MSKLSLFLSSVILFGFMPTPSPAGLPQDTNPAPAPASTSKNPVKPTPESQARAKKLYSVDCEMCHAANGNGKTDLAKDLQVTLLDWTDPKALSTKSDEELFSIIRKGKNKMPSEESNRAKDDDVWNLVIYIRGMSKAQPATAAKADN
jgi:cytochrome c5